MEVWLSATLFNWLCE